MSATATAPASASLSVTVSREKLQEGLAAVNAAVATRTTLPILANVLLETNDVGLRLTATDLDLSITTEIAADVSNSGALTLPAKRLQTIAKELPPAPVRIRTGKTVIIDAGRASFKLHSLPLDDFPILPTIDFADSIRIQAGDLQAMAKATSYAASTEDSRPILNGVLWELTDDQSMRLVATDGHQLALRARELQNPMGGSGLRKELIVPRKALDQIARLFSATDELEVAWVDHHLGIRGPNASFISRLIEGPYPNFTQVLPGTSTTVVDIDRTALAAAVKRMMPVASSSMHRLAMRFQGTILKIRASTPDVGEGLDELAVQPVTTGSNDLQIGVNARYLLDALAAIGGDVVRVSMTQPSRAIKLTPADQTDDGAAIHLVMPLRIDEE